MRLTLHDVVTVGDETDTNGQSNHSDLPERHRLARLGGGTSAPGSVHTGPDTDSVADIVGTVGERGGTGSDNLDEGVQVFGLVGVLLGVVVDAGHTLAFGSALNTDLSVVMSVFPKSDVRIDSTYALWIS